MKIWVCIYLVLICLNIIGCSVFQEQYDYPDFDGDILSSYTSTMDFAALLTKENPVESVNTRSSILYKNDHQRQMYVFSVPVREYVNGQYEVYDLSLYPDGDKQFMTKTNACQLSVSESAISLDAGQDTLHLLTDQMVLHDDDAVYLGENFQVSVTPSYSGYILNYLIDTPMEQLSLSFEKTRYKINDDAAGYVLLTEEDINKFMINQMIITDHGGNFSIGHPYQVTKNSDRFTITSEIPEG